MEGTYEEAQGKREREVRPTPIVIRDGMHAHQTTVEIETDKAEGVTVDVDVEESSQSRKGQRNQV